MHAEAEQAVHIVPAGRLAGNAKLEQD